jgi:RNA polymerase sigma-70 factor (ECF subfamily)
MQDLLRVHRGRLRQMVVLHMDRRLAARFDPSDVVQEALAEAARKMPDYLRRRPIPFYPWLRQIAWERLMHLHTRHLRSAKRTVTREESWVLDLSDESAVQLASRLVNNESSPSRQVLKRELQRRVREALERLSPQHREILVLRYLEQLRVAEIAAVLGISQAAVKMRHVRALDRLRCLLDDEPPSG